MIKTNLMRLSAAEMAAGVCGLPQLNLWSAAIDSSIYMQGLHEKFLFHIFCVSQKQLTEIFAKTQFQQVGTGIFYTFWCSVNKHQKSLVYFGSLYLFFLELFSEKCQFCVQEKISCEGNVKNVILKFLRNIVPVGIF